MDVVLQGGAFWHSQVRHKSRRLLRAVPRQITSALQADMLWNLGFSGKGVKVSARETRASFGAHRRCVVSLNQRFVVGASVN